MSFPRYEGYKDSGLEWLGEVPEHHALESAVANRQQLRVIRGDGTAIRAATFSPDGRRILAGANYADARLLDAETGVEIRVLHREVKPGPPAFVFSVGFSPDGAVLAVRLVTRRPGTTGPRLN